MTTRYYRATDGERTFYRASSSVRIYRSLIVRGGGDWGFSGKPPVSSHGSYPATEITESELATLRARRNEWIKASGNDVANYTAPYDSWLPNTMLEG